MRRIKEKASEEMHLREIGQKIKQRRTQLGFSLEELGKALGISRVQAYKYEEGTSKIDCLKMLEAASFLKVPTSYFFLADKTKSQKSEELAMHFNKLSNEIIKDAVIGLCEKISQVPEITS